MCVWVVGGGGGMNKSTRFPRFLDFDVLLGPSSPFRDRFRFAWNLSWPLCGHQLSEGCGGRGEQVVEVGEENKHYFLISRKCYRQRVCKGGRRGRGSDWNVGKSTRRESSLSL